MSIALQICLVNGMLEPWSVGEFVCVSQASKNLFYVPRFRGHTIIHPVTAKYGRVKVHAYPMTSGSGVRASKLMESICRLAGLQNIGIKVYTSGLPSRPGLSMSVIAL